MRPVLLQSATAFLITKCDGLLLQSATAFLLQSATSTVLLQSATVITKSDNFITKCDRYYKVRRLFQSATVHTCKRSVAFVIVRTLVGKAKFGKLTRKVIDNGTLFLLFEVTGYTLSC